MTTEGRRGRSLAGTLASAAGYVWLLIAILSEMGILELPGLGAVSVFPAFILILVGRALRNRAQPTDPSVDMSTEPVVLEMPSELDPAPVPSPPPPKPTPSPRTTPPPQPRPAQPSPDPVTAKPSPQEKSDGAPVSSETRQPVPGPKVKTSREMIEEAHARWGSKKP